MEFEWDPEKAATNLEVHGIDFDDAIGIFATAAVVSRSDRAGEVRWVAIGEIDGREIAVVYTIRGEYYRIISARRARKNERAAYRKARPGG